MAAPLTWIDSHCHLDAAEFDADRDAVRAAARAVGVGLCVLPAVAVANFDTVRELAQQVLGGGYHLRVESTSDAAGGNLIERLRAVEGVTDVHAEGAGVWRVLASRDVRDAVARAMICSFCTTSGEGVWVLAQ